MTNANGRFPLFLTMIGLAMGLILLATIVRVQAAPREKAATAQTDATSVAVDADDIGGTVTSSNGPEAGVWVIAETDDLGTKFRKIVVTNDHGQYLLPQLPKATYKVWVRGYGLVDSPARGDNAGENIGADRRGGPHSPSSSGVLSCRLLVLTGDQHSA